MYDFDLPIGTLVTRTGDDGLEYTGVIISHVDDRGLFSVRFRAAHGRPAIVLNGFGTSDVTIVDEYREVGLGAYIAAAEPAHAFHVQGTRAIITVLPDTLIVTSMALPGSPAKSVDVPRDFYDGLRLPVRPLHDL